MGRTVQTRYKRWRNIRLVFNPGGLGRVLSVSATPKGGSSGSAKGDVDAFGGSAGGTYWALLVSSRFSLSKAVNPEVQKHYFTSSARYHSLFVGWIGANAASP